MGGFDGSGDVRARSRSHDLTRHLREARVEDNVGFLTVAVVSTCRYMYLHVGS